MKALALAAAVSLTLSLAAFAQDSKPSLKPNGAKQPTEAAANIDVAAIQKKIDVITEALKKDPMNDALLGARGDGYQRIGNLDHSLADLTRAIELNSKRQAYYSLRGNVFGKLKRYRDSYSDYSKALEIGPKTHNLYLMQGKAASLSHDYTLALRAAKNADGIKSGDPETLVLLGTSEHMCGMYSEALKHLSRAIEINPADAGAISIRADTYSKLGKTDLAKLDQKRAKELGWR